jgi:DnaK suppressor protein
MRVALMGRRTQQLVQIQDALERLSAGQYGHCQECDEFIGTARLRALPFAQRCRDCQALAERRARRESILIEREAPRELEAA